MQPKPNLANMLGFLLLFYLLFLGAIVVLYPLAQQYAKPIASVIFPIAPNTSLLKNVIVMSGMDWGMALLYLLATWKR
jgi:hypothetical protein